MGRTTQILLLLAATLDTAFPVVVIWLDVTSTDLDWMQHAVSRHANGPDGEWMSFAFACHAAAMFTLAWAVHRLPPYPWAGPTALDIAGIASALLFVFPADARDLESTLGHLHEAFAPVAFLGVTFAAFFTTHAQLRHPRWQGFEKAPRFLAFALAGSLAVLGLVVLTAQFYDDAHQILGAMERLVILLLAAWMVTEAVQGFRVAVRIAP